MNFDGTIMLYFPKNLDADLGTENKRQFCLGFVKF